MKILFIMSIFIAISCGQKDKTYPTQKSATIQKPVELPSGQPKRPEYAIKAPDFTLKTVDGRLFKLSENKGKVILLNFWSLFDLWFIWPTYSWINLFLFATKN